MYIGNDNKTARKDQTQNNQKAIKRNQKQSKINQRQAKVINPKQSQAVKIKQTQSKYAHVQRWHISERPITSRDTKCTNHVPRPDLHRNPHDHNQ